jgi:FAD/FMN-containing dehydrogenase/Fe-S oxidoreductase
MSAAAPPPESQLLKDFFEELTPRVAGELHSDSMSRALYATDASMYEIQPVGVLLPRRLSDVQAALEVAAEFSIPVLPRGGGSSLAGQTVGEALVIDFSRHLDEILEINPDEKYARVQPGLVLDRLNAAAAEHGLVVGPDPASSSRATLGGMMANNATGTHSITYGNFIHHIRSAKGYLADGTPFEFGPLSDEEWEERSRRSGREGEVYRRLDALLRQKEDTIRRETPEHWRRNSGYRPEHLLPNDDGAPRNPAELLCGSEGTLAVVTELTFDLKELPERTALGVCHFKTRQQALRAVTTILETDPAAIELFDGMAVESARESPGYRHRMSFVEGNPGGVLITEYFGETESDLNARLDELEATLEGESYAVGRHTDPASIDNIWTVRKEGLGLIMSVKGDYKPWAFIEDASVPVEHLPQYVDELSTLLDRTNTKAVFYAHASAGTLHVRPFINTKKKNEVDKMRDIARQSMELVSKYGGAVSSEHGDGLARSWLNEELLGEELYQTCVAIKKIFDPDNLLNPGKVVDAPEMTRNLRMGPDYETIPLIEELDWSDDGGFARSVELCNGNGACRKLDSGTMCPSFMVTREEEDSTRGRANALRMAMSGGLPEEELTSERMHDVMDLCVQCKACKTECPSNVDMAKMKTEWLGRYWSAHGVPMRTRIFANMPRVTRLVSGTPLASVVNWVNRLTPVRKVMDWTLGISSERELPQFTRKPFTDWFEKQEWPTGGPPVVIFADTFNNYNHPETGRAAAEFYRAAGFEVRVTEQDACCGRPFLSKGYVNKAQSQVLKTVEQLYEHAEREVPIVGLEPSCTSVFTDDMGDMLPGDLRAEKVALSFTSFEEHVAKLAEGGALDGLDWTGKERRVLLHGHCHQKALVGNEPAQTCLGLPPGYAVETVDSGCCGMAGAFGYEKEHQQVSRDMAERRLAPAVRAMPDDALVAAAGVSCRAQIEDLTDRRALHPAEVLRDALV